MGENEEMVHPFLKNWSLISLFYDLRTETKQSLENNGNAQICQMFDQLTSFFLFSFWMYFYHPIDLPTCCITANYIYKYVL